jgi:hypothetical protein
VFSPAWAGDQQGIVDWTAVEASTADPLIVDSWAIIPGNKNKTTRLAGSLHPLPIPDGRLDSNTLDLWVLC